MALYRPLCSVLHSEGEGTALYRPLCHFFYSRGLGRLSTVPCVRLYMGISVAFRGGGGIRYPPPSLSGGSKLKNSTCGVEKKNRPPLDHVLFSLKYRKLREAPFFSRARGTDWKGAETRAMTLLWTTAQRRGSSTCFSAFFFSLSVYRGSWRMYIVPVIAQHNEMAFCTIKI